MLEWGGALRTWSLSHAPDSQAAITAEALPDHRLAYLDFEGEISGGRGAVARWDQGTYALLEDEHAVEVALHGRRLAGRARLTPEVDRLQGWRFEFLAEQSGP
jgi:hypothetical protein